MKLAYL